MTNGKNKMSNNLRARSKNYFLLCSIFIEQDIQTYAYVHMHNKEKERLDRLVYTQIHCLICTCTYNGIEKIVLHDTTGVRIFLFFCQGITSFICPCMCKL